MLQRVILVLHAHKLPEKLLCFLAIEGDQANTRVRHQELDASIQTDTANVNDFSRFLAVHADICLIVFNGQKAQQLFRKFVRMEDEDGLLQHIACKVLPSTSPAYAAMPFSGKLGAWKTALDGVSKSA